MNMFNFLKGFYKEDIDTIKDQLRDELRQEMKENLKARNCEFDSMFMSLKNNGSDKTFTSDEAEAKIKNNEEKRIQAYRKAKCDYYNKENRDILNLNNNLDHFVDTVHNMVAGIIKEGNFEEYSENDHGYNLTIKEHVDRHFDYSKTLRDVLKMNCQNNEMSNYIITKRDFIEKLFDGSKFSDNINDLKLFKEEVDEITHYYNAYDIEEVFYVDLDETYDCRYGWKDSDYPRTGLTNDNVMEALAKLHFLVNYAKRSFEKYNCVIFISSDHCFDICTDEEIL